MKIKSVIVSVLAVALVVTAVGVASAKIQLTVLRPGTPEKVAAFLEPAIQEFEKANPDIEVNIQYAGWNEYLTRLATWIAAGEAPDVFLTNDHTMPYYAEQGALLPLDDLLNEELKTQIPASLWSAAVWKGKTYLVPASVGAIMLFWHKDLFADAGLDPNQPPANMDEFLTYAQKTTKNDYFGYGLTMGTWDTGWEEEVSLFYHGFTDKPWFDEKGKPLFDTKEARKAFEFVVDLANKYKVIYPNPFEYTRGEMRPVFRDKKVAMHSDGPWFYPMLAENFDFSSKEASEVGIAPMPRNGTNGSIMGADGWVIFSKTKHPKEAVKLLNFLVNEENQYNHGVLYGVAPTQKRLFEKGDYQKWYWQPQVEAVKTAFPRAHTPFTKEFYIEAFKYTQLAITGQMPVKVAFDKIVNTANELASQY